MLDFNLIAKTDSEMAGILKEEVVRQQEHIVLIASENYVSEAVLETSGSHLTNKYAEGYPGKRFYGGCELADKTETLAIERAKELFGAEHANVQPHCGASANMAVYLAFMQPGDTLLGMDLSHGGHLSHGSKVNCSGKYYNSVTYGVEPDTEMIDYDKLEKIAIDCQPKVLVAGASAYPRVIDFKRLKEIADKVNAKLVVDIAHIAGLVAAGVHPSPVPYADAVTTTTHKTLRGPRGGLILCKAEHQKAIDSAVFPGLQGGPLMHIIAAKAVCFKEALQPSFKEYQEQIVKNAAAMANRLKENGFRLVSGGTDNHLMLIDVLACGTTGKEMQILLDSANITANKNTIPFETLSPFQASGVRLGTPAMTTRGMKEPEAILIADLITRIIKERESAVPEVKATVLELCKKFPLYNN